MFDIQIIIVRKLFFQKLPWDERATPTTLVQKETGGIEMQTASSPPTWAATATCLHFFRVFVNNIFNFVYQVNNTIRPHSQERLVKHQQQQLQQQLAAVNYGSCYDDNESSNTSAMYIVNNSYDDVPNNDFKLNDVTTNDFKFKVDSEARAGTAVGCKSCCCKCTSKVETYYFITIWILN